MEVDSVQPGILQVRCRGTHRFELRSTEQQADGLWVGDARMVDDDAVIAPDPSMHGTVRGLVNAIATLRLQSALPFLEPFHFDDAGWVANRWCEILPIPMAAKQRLMELEDPVVRLRLVDEFLRSKGVVEGGLSLPILRSASASAAQATRRPRPRCWRPTAPMPHRRIGRAALQHGAPRVQCPVEMGQGMLDRRDAPRTHAEHSHGLAPAPLRYRTAEASTARPIRRVDGRCCSHTRPRHCSHSHQFSRLPAPELAGLHRITIGLAFAPCGAQFMHRAQQASRRLRNTHACTEIHQALRIRLDALERQQPRRMRPQLALAGRLARSPRKPITRASTRLTLPSRIAARSP